MLETPKGTLELLDPTAEQLQKLREALPLGIIRLSEQIEQADYGIIMKCGEQEAWCVKLQPPDIQGNDWQTSFLVKSLIVALSLSGYRDAGFDGLLMPLPYCREKEGCFEAGVAVFGSAWPGGFEAREFDFNQAWDPPFGHGFTAMLIHFIQECKKASSGPVSLEPVIGMDHRSKSALGTVGMGFFALGHDIWSCKRTIDAANDPVWTALRSTGVDRVIHLPSVPMEIEEKDRLLAKPNYTGKN